MKITLPFRVCAVTAVTGLLLIACDPSGEPRDTPPPSPTPTASSPSLSTPTPSVKTQSPTTSAPAPSALSPTTPAPTSSAPLIGVGRLQPMWPFTTLAQAQAWERAFAAGGHQPWHLDPEQTALSFTQDYLGFREIDRVTKRSVTATQARIGVGLSGPESSGSAAVIHLVRYGTGPNAPWEVVGTDDTTFSMTKPAYGSVVRSPVRTGGRITGVDESIRVQIRQPSSKAPLGESCCPPAGGSNQPWSSSVSFTKATDPVLTIVASTGGHIAEVERFTVTAVRTR
ncbi:hypothetical protein QWM81_22610 [Streptomyces ficellus]|uniref:Tat pathway signal sequence domain protein n=1 Tax=Streptomyces ficellus TaxID=1977088 RepID=A0ABT7ZBZ0_9ACTN|nr:hypothetical protein [Streptomyces ficellus]MDN3296787.1 hypothetical protein [Streptomyces ficellus]